MNRQEKSGPSGKGGRPANSSDGCNSDRQRVLTDEALVEALVNQGWLSIGNIPEGSETGAQRLEEVWA